MTPEEITLDQKNKLLMLENEELQRQVESLKEKKKEEKKSEEKKTRNCEKTIRVYSITRLDGTKIMIVKEDYWDKVTREIKEEYERCNMSEEDDAKIMAEMMKFQAECDKQDKLDRG